MAIIFTVVQVGGSVYVAGKNTYASEYLPIVDFLRDTVRPGELVVGGPELGFALGFDSNLSDDIFLGYYTSSRPVAIVIDGRYRSSFGSFRRGQPAIYDFVQRTLANDFAPAYQIGDSTVYRRLAATGETTSSPR